MWDLGPWCLVSPGGGPVYGGTPCSFLKVQELAMHGTSLCASMLLFHFLVYVTHGL